MDQLLLVLIVVGVTLVTVRWLLTGDATPVSRQAVRHLLLQQLLLIRADAKLVADDEESLAVRLAGHTCTIELGHLYRLCAQQPAKMGTLVAQAVQAVSRAFHEQRALPETWQARVTVLLLPAGADTARLLTRPLLPALTIGYALTEDGYLRWLTPEDLEQATLNADELHALALRNIERSYSTLVIDAPSSLPDGRDHMLSFDTGDGLDAARLLVPSFYQRYSPRFGETDLLVAIPDRDSLTIISAANSSEAGMLAWHTRQAFARSPYPLYEGLLKVTEDGIQAWQPDPLP